MAVLMMVGACALVGVDSAVLGMATLAIAFYGFVMTFITPCCNMLKFRRAQQKYAPTEKDEPRITPGAVGSVLSDGHDEAEVQMIEMGNIEKIVFDINNTKFSVMSGKRIFCTKFGPNFGFRV